MFRILCVDDEPLGLQVRKMVLEAQGYHVTTAPDGDLALRTLEKEKFDLVVIDFAMPGMNGGEVAKVIRETQPALPLILLSAYVDLPPEVVARFDRYVVKGETPALLIENIRELLRPRNANSNSAA